MGSGRGRVGCEGLGWEGLEEEYFLRLLVLGMVVVVEWSHYRLQEPDWNPALMTGAAGRV